MLAGDTSAIVDCTKSGRADVATWHKSDIEKASSLAEAASVNASAGAASTSPERGSKRDRKPRMPYNKSSSPTKPKPKKVDDEATESEDGDIVVTCDVCEKELNNSGGGVHCEECIRDYCTGCAASTPGGGGSRCDHEKKELPFVPFQVQCKCKQKCKGCRCRCKCKPSGRKRKSRTLEKKCDTNVLLRYVRTSV